MEEIRKENEKYLAIFQEYLESYGMSRPLIERHISNIDGYFVNNITDRLKTLTLCAFPRVKESYDEELENTDETYSCSLYSQDPVFMEKKVNISYNYTEV